MKTLIVIVLLAAPLQLLHAQDIYKWEDERGVVHYGDRPRHPSATPFQKDGASYSRTEEAADDTIQDQERSLLRQNVVEKEPRERMPRVALPSPTLRQPKAWIDRPRGDFWISGAVHNSGSGVCDSPTIEVTVLDEMGSVDGRFEVQAEPGELRKGEDVQFRGKHFAPVGDKLSWEAMPRCGSEIGPLYGPRKRGSLKITHHRKLRLKTFTTK